MFFIRRSLPRVIGSSYPKLSRTIRIQRTPSLPPDIVQDDMSPVFSKDAMPPIGPYSQATQTKHAIYCSGQLPADKNGNIVEGSMDKKTEACFKALHAVLRSAGSSLDRIVKVQIFLTDMKDFPEMNLEYAKWIKHAPARSCVAVKELPRGVDIEIECIALPGYPLWRRNPEERAGSRDRKDTDTKDATDRL